MSCILYYEPFLGGLLVRFRKLGEAVNTCPHIFGVSCRPVFLKLFFPTLLRCVIRLWSQLSFGSYPPASATDDEQDLRDTWFPKARDCTCCKVSFLCFRSSVDENHISSLHYTAVFVLLLFCSFCCCCCCCSFGPFLLSEAYCRYVCTTLGST